MEWDRDVYSKPLKQETIDIFLTGQEPELGHFHKAPPSLIPPFCNCEILVCKDLTHFLFQFI